VGEREKTGAKGGFLGQPIFMPCVSMVCTEARRRAGCCWCGIEQAKPRRADEYAQSALPL